ncbi:sulfur reduction protein DsrE [Erwinia pyri]|uniref:Sulfur reduction protein DsrE n=1 Tax=Erwinia pyri TaxID=3062598 RepID=A0AA50DL89_9GAMM|nr:sulfur reduction protein DsrE [Erwinia sp. DE2]WLS80006.1 sulfur reduction protein DsrE [Erwinia sp. DE2]
MRQTLNVAAVAIIASLATVAALKAPTIIEKVSSLTAGNATQPEGFWQTPAIKGYGKIHNRPESAFRPQSSEQYNVVFQVQDGHEPKKAVNAELEKVARTVNLYVASGVPLESLKFVVAIAGSATPVVLNNERYREEFGVDNPNLPLIARLREAGVVVSVCDQAVAGHRYGFDWVDKNVTHALSNLTTITTLEKKGYMLMPM